MTIKNMDENHFRAILKENLTPSRAITSPQYLRGRERMLMQISRAFNSPGKHVFVYGDRGVGKTSLAQTAATIHQSSDAEPVLVSCSGASFLSTVRDAVRESLPIGDTGFQKKIEHKLKAGVAGFGYEMTHSMMSGEVPLPSSINDAVQLLRFVGEVRTREPVIIFDEFDQLTNDEDRKTCADLIKQVSERTNVRFIICGIGASLVSVRRHLASIESVMIPWCGRFA